MLIIFAGLPGTGKTTLAIELARRVDATYLRIDTIEQAITDSSLRIYPTEDAGYMAGYAVAEDNLRIGRTVVADSVNPIGLTRDAWRDVVERGYQPWDRGRIVIDTAGRSVARCVDDLVARLPADMARE